MNGAASVRDRVKFSFKPAALIACGLLSVLVMAIWVRSHSQGERYRILTSYSDAGDFVTKSYTFNSSAGGIQVMYVCVWTDSEDTSLRMRNERRYFFSPGYSKLRDLAYPMRGADDSVLSSLGFQTALMRGRSDEGWRETLGWVTIPYWFLMLLACAYPVGKYALAVVRRQQEERAALGLCTRCGEPVEDSLVRCRGCNKPVVMLSEASV